MAVWTTLSESGSSSTVTFASVGVIKRATVFESGPASTETLGTAKFWLKKNGSLTGTIYCRVWDVDGAGGAAGSVIATSSTTLTDSDLTTSFQEFEFIFSPEIDMSTEDYGCGIEYTDQTNMLTANRYGTNTNTATAGTWGNYFYQNGWYFSQSGKNLISEGVEGSTPPPPPPSSGTRFPPPPIILGGL